MKRITVIVETPMGSRQKYNFDEGLHLFRLKKLLPNGMVFPFDFGFIPGTKAADGDPIDVLVIAEFSTFTGCVMDCKIIGGITAMQTLKDGSAFRNDRIFVVPEASVAYAEIQTLNQLPAGMIEEIQAFFVNYNTIEGKDFKILQTLQAGQASGLLALD